MKEFSLFVKQKVGITLSTNELTRLYTKYFDEASQSINYDRFTADLHSAAEKYNSPSPRGHRSETKEPLKFTEIINQLRNRLIAKSDNQRDNNQLKNAFLLLSESRSSVLTRSQLKSSCRYRLDIMLSDFEVDEVFNQLDTFNSGVINVKQLVSLIFKNDPNAAHLVRPGTASGHRSTKNVLFGESCETVQHVKKQPGGDRDSENQNAHITYDNQFKGLTPPDLALCPKYLVSELEKAIYEKIFERSGVAAHMVQVITKLFSHGQKAHSSADQYNNTNVISKEQFSYTVWKKLKLNVSPQDIDDFFAKHDRNGSGSIPMHDFCQSIVKRQGTNEPILEDRTNISKSERFRLVGKLRANQPLREFFVILRQKIDDLVNREGRAPTYLLHDTAKMTIQQAITFLKQKLNFDIAQYNITSQQFVSLLQEYLIKGDSLIDVRRILLETMTLSEIYTIGSSGSSSSNGTSSTSALAEAIQASNLSQQDSALANSGATQFSLQDAIVTVSKMPVSLAHTSRSPQQIEALIVNKCNERLKKENPHYSLHKMFRDSNCNNSREITRKGMRALLNRFDILVSGPDFEAFFAKHDRGDDRVNIDDLLHHLMPPSSAENNPYLPKDAKGLRYENDLLKAIEDLTGKKSNRLVSQLNGTTFSSLTPSKPSSTAGENAVASSNGTFADTANQLLLQQISKRAQQETNPLLVAAASPAVETDTETVADDKEPLQVVISPSPVPASASPVTFETIGTTIAPFSPQRPATASATMRSSKSRSSPRLKNASKSSVKLVTGGASAANLTASAANLTNSNNASNTASVANMPVANAAAKTQCILTPSQLNALNSYRASSEEKSNTAIEQQHVYNRAYELFMTQQERNRASQQAKQITTENTSEMVDTLLAATSPRSPRSKNQSSTYDRDNNFANDLKILSNDTVTHVPASGHHKRPASAPSARRTPGSKSTLSFKHLQISTPGSKTSTSSAYTSPMQVHQYVPYSPLNTAPHTSSYSPRSARSSAPDYPVITSYSPRIPNPKFVYTGQLPQRHAVDANNELLRIKYRHSGQTTLTSHQQYGLFVKNLNKKLKHRDDLFNQHLQEVKSKGTNSFTSTPLSPHSPRSSQSPRSPRSPYMTAYGETN